ncbi:MAG TPA: hypothetical protein VIV57_05560 [Anaeromyxobacter sp.]
MSRRDRGANAAPGRRELSLRLPPSERGRFHALLQRGVTTRIPARRSALELLTADLGLDPEYVRTRITTVFVDGRVVDALESATLEPGSLLALSAAMPGLVGATLRRGGPYAAMRAEITRPPVRGSRESASATCLVRVRLFNLLLDEVGPSLLARGILLPRGEALALLGDLAPAPEAWPPGEDVELRVQFS